MIFLPCGVQVPGGSLAVNEGRFGALVDDGVGAGREGEGGDQHLVARADARMNEGQVQRGRARTECQRMRCAGGRGKPCPEQCPELVEGRVEGSASNASTCGPSGAIQLDAQGSWTNPCARPDMRGESQMRVMTGASSPNRFDGIWGYLWIVPSQDVGATAHIPHGDADRRR